MAENLVGKGPRTPGFLIQCSEMTGHGPSSHLPEKSSLIEPVDKAFQDFVLG